MVGGSNGQTIRGALIDLIKFYVGREIKFEELSHLLGCICAVHDEVVVRITVVSVLMCHYVQSGYPPGTRLRELDLSVQPMSS